MAIKASKQRRVALYARVSTKGQSTANQLRDLKAWAKRCGHQVVAEYVDSGVSGAKGRDKRPQFDALLKAAVRREFDIVAAWSVDRLGRSLQDLLGFLNEVHASGVDLYLHQQGLDSTTPGGKALFQMCGVFAEFERAIIVERINAGLERARANGTRSGKPIGRPAVDLADKRNREKVRRIRELRQQGHGVLKVCKLVKCGPRLVYRIEREGAIR